MSHTVNQLRAASWNIASVNNNPFEYWITHPDPAYDSLMQGVEQFIESQENDVPVNDIFSDQMFIDICKEMSSCRISGLDILQHFWFHDYRHRMAIAEFLKDKIIGLKRLVSMPDRITNTINLHDGGVIYRPAVINAYGKSPLNSISDWWKQWRLFMFHTSAQIAGELHMEKQQELVCDLIGPILRSKYPAVSIEEQSISIPLQILCLAIFDAIMLHIMIHVQPENWENIRRNLCEVLIEKKGNIVCSILDKQYGGMDVIFIQESAAIFIQQVHQQPNIRDMYTVLLPSNLDGKRDQNSVILVNRERFDHSSSIEVTSQVLELLEGTFIAPGDLLIVSIADWNGMRWLLASFHGDSSGLSTQLVMCAVDKIARHMFADHILLIGLDANTHSCAHGEALHSVNSFAKFLRDCKLTSLWGDVPDPSIRTTCSSRTFMQTQLNKARPYRARSSISTQNLRDWILSYRFQTVAVDAVCLDNTGFRAHLPGTVLPTVEFPSDHEIISAVFHLQHKFPPVSHRVDNAMAADEVQTFRQDEPENSGLAVPTNDCGQRVAEGETEERPAPRELRQNYSDRPSAVRRRTQLERVTKQEQTLYDYWRISDPGERRRQRPVETWKIADSSQAGRDKLLPQLRERYCRGVCDGSAIAECAEVEMERFCERHYAEFVSNSRGQGLDVQRAMFSQAEDKSIWVMFSSTPASTIVCKRWGQMAAVSIAMSFLFEGLYNTIVAAQANGFAAQYFRFTPLRLRNGSFATDLFSSSPFISDFGLLVDRCKVNVKWTKGRAAIEDSKFILSFPQPVYCNGYYFQTAGPEQDPSADPVSFRFEVSDDGNTWRTIVSPPWILLSAMTAVPSARLAYKLIDLSPPWQWIILNSLGMFLLGLGSLCCIALGVVRQGRRAIVTLAWTYMVYSALVLMLSGYDWFAGDDDKRAEAMPLLLLSAVVALNGAVVYRERYVLECWPVMTAVLGAMNLMVRLAHSVTWVSMVVPGVSTFVPMFLNVTLVIARHLTSNWVFDRSVDTERQAYDAVWADVVTCDAGRGVLERLCECVEKVVQRLPSSAATMCQGRCESPDDCRHNEDGHSVRLGGGQSPSTQLRQWMSRSRAKVTSLQQLYLQAGCLDVFLREKVKQLGVAADGLAQVEDGTEARRLEAWRDIAAGKVGGRLVWAGLKPVDRALEKLRRTYECDVSRLLDCCRQMILFTDVEHLLECLRTLLKDKEVEIVRIKNRMDQAFNSRYSGGFRNIVLNVRIRTEHTRRLAIDQHICELQLTLVNFYEIMSEEQHDRYLLLRNCRDYPSIFRVAADTAAAVLPSRRRLGQRLGASFRRRRTSELHSLPDPQSSTAGSRPTINVDSSDCDIYSRSDNFEAGDAGCDSAISTDIGLPFSAAEGDRVPAPAVLEADPTFHCKILVAAVDEAEMAQQDSGLRPNDGGMGTQMPSDRDSVLSKKDSVDMSSKILSSDRKSSAPLLPKRENENESPNDPHPGAVKTVGTVDDGQEATAAFAAPQTSMLSMAMMATATAAENILRKPEIAGTAGENLLRAERLRMLEQQFVVSMRCTTSRVGPQQDRYKVLQDAMEHVTMGGVFDTSQPFAAALCKPRIWVFILIAFVCLSVDLVVIAMDLHSQDPARGMRFRFTALETREGAGQVASGPGIQALRMLVDGCTDALDSTVPAMAVAAASTTLSYPAVISPNGWRFFTSAEVTPAEDPVRFLLEASESANGSDWRVVGASGFKWTWAHRLLLYPGFYYRTPLGRNESVDFDLRLPPTWAVSRMLSDMIMMMVTSSLLYIVASGNQLHGRWVVAIGSGMQSLLDAALAMACVLQGQPDLGFVPGVYIVIDLCMALTFGLYERYIVLFLLLAGPAYLVVLVAYYCALIGYSEGLTDVSAGTFSNSGFVSGLWITGLAAMAYFSRFYNRIRADRIIARDRIAYGICWQNLTADPASVAALEKLECITARLAQSLPAIVRQRSRHVSVDNCGVQGQWDLGHTNPKRSTIGQSWGNYGVIRPSSLQSPRPMAASDATLLAVRTISHNVVLDDVALEMGPPIMDLDQLLVQAAGLDASLKMKVQEWALLAGGCFAVLSPVKPAAATGAARSAMERFEGGKSDDLTAFQRWEKVAGDEKTRQRVKWARPKARRRAVEKLFRSYECDASRLLDCCRQSIYFEDVDGMLRCMELIAADAAVRLKRINNRLTGGYDARRSAGYRDLSLNLQLGTPETARLKVDTHICEVQLVLVSFARIKDRPEMAMHATSIGAINEAHEGNDGASPSAAAAATATANIPRLMRAKLGPDSSEPAHRDTTILICSLRS